MATRVKITDERLELGAGFRRAYTACLFVGGAATAAAILVTYLTDPSFKSFYFAWLVNWSFFLSISLGAAFFVLTQHITRAGWSVATRRVAETLACVLPMLASLAAPIVISVILQNGELYRWAQSSGLGLNEAVLEKRAYLNPGFFLVRLLIYFLIWSVIGVGFWWMSVRQDKTGEVAWTRRMQTLAAPAMLVLFLSVTFASFDLLMSLDPAWFSTMFGIYFFSGCAVAIFASLILIVALLQRHGYLSHTVTNEHFHDLGKFLFAFTFFWGYIAFSQYMLLWYANMPETGEWYARRGATTVHEDINAWTVVSLLLLFGNLLIPFAGLLSRHVKRTRVLLVFWAAWLLVFHWVDLYWLIVPELDGKLHFGILDVLCFIGIGGLYLATLLRIGLLHNLRPIADPRLEESLAFENI